MQISEYKKSIDHHHVDNLTFIKGVVFVIWDWEWVGEDSDHESDISATSILEPSPNDEDDADVLKSSLYFR